MANLNANASHGNENPSSQEGIEANDLAGLLTMFEEATSSSVDDMAVPSACFRRKKRVLMKAKSAGNSPAITPPVTPPPFPSRQRLARTLTVGTKPLLVKNQTKPLQFTVVVPAQNSTVSSSPSGSLLSTALSSQLLSQSASVVVQPKVLLQNTLANKLSVQTVSPIQIKGAKQLHTSSSPKIFIRPLQAVTSLPKMPAMSSASVLASQLPVLNSSVHHIISSSSGTLSAFSVQPAHSNRQPVHLLSMPVIDSCPPQALKKLPLMQLIPKTKANSPTNSSVGMKLKPSTSSSQEASPLLLSSSQVTKKLPITSVESSLLQSMLVNPSTTMVSSKLSSSIFSQQKDAPSQTNNSDSKLQSKRCSNIIKIGLPSVKSAGVSTPRCNTTSPLVNSMVVTAQVGGCTITEHAYCSSTSLTQVSDLPNNDLNRSSSQIQLTEKESSFVAKDVESTEIEFEGKPTKCVSPALKPINEFVFEDGEIQVDEDGNDLLKPNICPSPSTELTSADDPSSSKAVTFGRSNAPSSSRRGRRYRKRAELRNSPIREDTNNFFDKIPSHYTVLSIPSKPMKTTAFESTTKAIGSMDHLEFSNVPEVSIEDGHYDKVPAYRSIFTNTTKELDIPSEETSSNNPPGEAEESYSRSYRSSSQHSHQSRSSHRSYRSGSRNSSGTRSMRSVSTSPDSRRGRPRSRSGRRRRSCSQISSCSSMSSSSSGSYCSTCGASLSRSRSRSGSCSSGRSRGQSYSRSRSRSPGQERDREMRRRRKLRSYSPEGRPYRSRSRSRSISPSRQRSTRYGRSERHRTKSRSSAERRIMERRKEREEDKIRAMEERRVVYVGKIPEGYTKIQLRKRFEQFGDIKGVKINFREHGDNYGFITFSYACDAIAAKEKGNNIPGEQKFDLCFGGRRRFCPDQYADLDGNREIEEEYAPMPKNLNGELDYAALLKQHLSQRKKKR